MNPSYDVIVIGLGTMGAATCAYLARRGARVLGLEQFGIPHAHGSAGGESRVIRLSYFEHPDYVPLLLRAYELWHDLSRETGRTVLYETGGMYLGPADGEFIRGSIGAARQYDLPHEVLENAEIKQRFPQFNVPEAYAGIFEPRAGVIIPELAVGAFAESALRHGAELHGHEPVRSWSSENAGIEVTTDRARYVADRLVICGGAWSGRLLRDLGVPLAVTRQTMGWFWPKRPELFEFGRFPVWAFEDGRGGLQYGFPLLQNRPGLKVARHLPAEATTPESVERTISQKDRRELLEMVDETLPEGTGPLLSASVCLYTNTPDGHFIVDQHPEDERVTLACGFSGHGFKFASVMGEALADLAQHGRTTHPVTFLGLDRFRK